MPINPTHEPHWRPDKDLNRSRNVTAVDHERPTTVQDALLYVSNLCLPEIVCYDGYDQLQNELIDEATKFYFPELFCEQKAVPGMFKEQSGEQNAINRFFERHTRNDGTVDWNGAANDTTYAVQREQTIAKTDAQSERQIHLGRLTLVDELARVG